MSRQALSNRSATFLLLVAACSAIGGCYPAAPSATPGPASAGATQAQPAVAPRDAGGASPRDWLDDVSPCVHDEWRAHRSGYALEEILNHHVLAASRWANSDAVKPGITTSRVLELLGEPDCKGDATGQACYPNYGPGDWLYNGSRRLMRNDYVHFHFDAEGVLMSVGLSGE